MANTQPTLTPDFILTFRDMMLAGLERELPTTKRVIAAVPDDRADYRPDPKSRTARELAWHIAHADVHFADGIANLSFNMDDKTEAPKTSSEMAAWYETNLKRAIERVRVMKAEQLLTPVNFYDAFNLPAALYLTFLNNHSIHHRGQLATYLRPMGSKVPNIYGGSADEEWKAA
jgi:uncharacterized damage-inducible protein DinB